MLPFINFILVIKIKVDWSYETPKCCSIGVGGRVGHNDQIQLLDLSRVDTKMVKKSNQLIESY